ncbi:MAG: redox-regulated ATPase YchF [Ardenticatenaceae bacterium]|nr:redox-regulated ATPase YchF [Ardenticatenaceae bacterium]HBY94607.1 redox-regulated ATPase YchF [Chloroflexota bacterium]
MKIGIIGLPNSGKTTVYNALTRGNAVTDAFSTNQVEVHTAVVDVPDPRIDRLSAMYRPKKTIYAKVTYNDIGGVTAGGPQSGGFGGPLINAIANNDALLHVVRAFKDPNVPHPSGRVNPGQDWRNLEAELILNDLMAVERRLERLEADLKKPNLQHQQREQLEAEQELFQRLQAHLEAEQPLRAFEFEPDEEKMVRSFTFLSQKPLLVVLNLGDEQPEPDLSSFEVGPRAAVTTLRGKLEAELAQMSPDEADEFLADFGIRELGLNRMIRMSHELLELKDFFTVGEDEVRAWTVPAGANAQECAAAIHTDLGRGFIRAETITYDDLIAAGSMAEARKHGQLRLEGKTYEVKDGDILNIRFNI